MSKINASLLNSLLRNINTNLTWFTFHKILFEDLKNIGLLYQRNLKIQLFYINESKGVKTKTNWIIDIIKNLIHELINCHKC